MNIDNFHRVFFDYLRCKSEDVARIVNLETNIEKWFQAEMALAFSSLKKDPYEIFSSYEYNSDEDWNNGKGGRKIVSIEGTVFKKVKIGRDEISGIRKVDFLLEDGEHFLFSEIKYIWVSENVNPVGENYTTNNFMNDLYHYLNLKGVFEDAWRLKRNLYDDFTRKPEKLKLYLTLIFIVQNEHNEGNDCALMKRSMAASINRYFDCRVIANSEDQISMDMVCTGNKNNVYLMSINL